MKNKWNKEANGYIVELLSLNNDLNERFEPFLKSLQKWNETKELTTKQIQALYNIEDHLRDIETYADLMIDSQSIY